MIWAHQLVTGYEWHFSETVLTLQLSPNYCYNCGNVTAILELDEHLQEDFSIFEAAPEGHGASPSRSQWLGFPGGSVVGNLPANAGDTGSSPDLGRSHMPQSN